MEKEDTLILLLNSPQTLADVLIRIYQQHDNAALIRVLTAVANKLALLHCDGISITPLTNNNVQLQIADAQGDIVVSISNTSLTQIATPLPMNVRGEQLAGISLPDDYWRIFKYMYFANQAIPDEFNEAAESRRQTLRAEQPGLARAEQDIWLWDDNSAQAMIVLQRQTKRSLRRKRDGLKLLFNNVIALPKIWYCYRALKRKAYQKTVTIYNKIGIALHPAYWQQEKALLTELSSIPVLIRFYCHETMQQWQSSIELIRELQTRKITVMVALVQDRNAVIDSEHWQVFLESVIPQIHSLVDWIEIGHATNRVKWGLWCAAEYSKLLYAVSLYKERYPALHLIGPAVIDFEWYKIIDLLKSLPKRSKLYALSQHLYVDRRGAPENFQGKFSTLEKCALAKAIAKSSRQCDNRYIISEFNWPLKETGIYSPIGSPYMAPEWFRDKPGVTETEYAHYLIRFLTIALCSSFVERAVIWRLSAHGYGLVDDRDGFRKRPAFFALQTYLQLLGNAQFIRKIDTEPECYLFEFKLDVNHILLAWTTDESMSINIPWKADKMLDLYGKPLQLSGLHVTLSSSPIYCIQEHA